MNQYFNHSLEMEVSIAKDYRVSWKLPRSDLQLLKRLKVQVNEEFVSAMNLQMMIHWYLYVNAEDLWSLFT